MAMPSLAVVAHSQTLWRVLSMVAYLAITYGLWLAVKLPRAGTVLAISGVVAITGFFVAAFVPGVPLAVFIAACVLCVVVIYGILLWRYRTTNLDPGDILETLSSSPPHASKPPEPPAEPRIKVKHADPAS